MESMGLSLYVTSFSSIYYCSNSDYWTQKFIIVAEYSTGSEKSVWCKSYVKGLLLRKHLWNYCFFPFEIPFISQDKLFPILQQGFFENRFVRNRSRLSFMFLPVCDSLNHEQPILQKPGFDVYHLQLQKVSYLVKMAQLSQILNLLLILLKNRKNNE